MFMNKREQNFFRMSEISDDLYEQIFTVIEQTGDSGEKGRVCLFVDINHGSPESYTLRGVTKQFKARAEQ